MQPTDLAHSRGPGPAAAIPWIEGPHGGAAVIAVTRVAAGAGVLQQADWR